MFYIFKLVTLLNSIRPGPDAVELHEGCPSSGDSLSTEIFRICHFPVLNSSCALQMLCKANFTPQGCAPQIVLQSQLTLLLPRASIKA